MILKQLFKLNLFIVYGILIFLLTLPLLGRLEGPGYLIPITLAFLLVYVFKLVPDYPRPKWKPGFYAGHILIILSHVAVGLSIALPILWSNLENDPNLLMLLWLTIPALVVAIPGWSIGLLLVWLCGTRRLPTPLIEPAQPEANRI